MAEAARWLDREALAQHISVRVDELPRLAKAGKLPTPSHHLGPRSPRWWSAEVDAIFGRAIGAAVPSQKGDLLVQKLLAGRTGRARRTQAAR